jgi:hypothetical protein
MTVFLTALLTAPVALSWQLLSLACAVLLALCSLVAYLVALIHAHIGKSWRELLVSASRVRVSWIWGWLVSCYVLLSYLTALAYLQRVASWLAALPYLIAAVVTLVIATWLRHSIRTKVVTMQKLIQGGRV